MSDCFFRTDKIKWFVARYLTKNTLLKVINVPIYINKCIFKSYSFTGFVKVIENNYLL